ncbi:MAG: hydantoinase/oxoprolinase family protein [Methylotenera sp.]
MNNGIIGWDVGGAHLKAALLDGDGKLQQVLQVPCALWRGLQELETAIDVVLNTFSTKPVLHAVTMTGELVDLFANRKAGVQSISRVMDANLSGFKQFYAGALKADFSGFVALQDVDQHWQHIASANWLASASFTGKQLQKLQNVQHSLLIDIGSTTSDFVLLENHQPACIGFTDASRMQSEELVYTGVIRTPLMAVAQKIRFENSVTAVAAEYFSTMADVYRLTGDLQAADDMAETADGQEKTQLASARRIARMIGHDVDDASLRAWTGLANEFKLQQVARLQSVALTHISRLSDKKQRQTMCVVGAGAGSFLAKTIAKAVDIQYLDIAELIEVNSENSFGNATGNTSGSSSETSRGAGVCLPAYAVAYLALN